MTHRNNSIYFSVTACMQYTCTPDPETKHFLFINLSLQNMLQKVKKYQKDNNAASLSYNE